MFWKLVGSNCLYWVWVVWLYVGLIHTPYFYPCHVYWAKVLVMLFQEWSISGHDKLFVITSYSSCSVILIMPIKLSSHLCYQVAFCIMYASIPAPDTIPLKSKKSYQGFSYHSPPRIWNPNQPVTSITFHLYFIMFLATSNHGILGSCNVTGWFLTNSLHPFLWHPPSFFFFFLIRKCPVVS